MNPDVRVALAAACLLVAAGCGGGGGGGSAPAPVAGPAAESAEAIVAQPTATISGIVSGPVADADISLVADDGSIIATGTSDGTARYQIEVEGELAFPLTARAEGGSDLVTQAPIELDLRALLFNEGTAHITPTTTLLAHAVECAGDVSVAAADRLASDLASTFAFGFDGEFGHPVTGEVTNANAAAFVLANGAVGEWQRRTMQALSASAIPADEVAPALGCELADGHLDGLITGSSGAGVKRVVATAKAVELAIALEALGGQLQVNGVEANHLIEQALATVMPESTIATVADAPITAGAGQRVLGTLRTLLPLAPEALSRLYLGLNDLQLDAMEVDDRNSVQELLGTNRDLLLALPDDVAIAPAELVGLLIERTANRATAGSPTVELIADADSVVFGGAVELSWDVQDADWCVAQGDWTGEQAFTGTFVASALEADGEFGLTCLGLGGVAQTRVNVSVQPFDDGGTPAEPEESAEPDTPAEPLPEPTPEPEPEPQPEPQPEPEPDPQPEPTPQPEPEPSTPDEEPETPGTGGGVDPEPTTPDDPVEPEPEPAPAPVVSFSTSRTDPDVGTSVTLSWTSEHADRCQASGGWSGTKALQGDQSIAINQTSTFTLNCSGDGGSAIEMLSVTAYGTVQLRWDPPTRNTDGTDIQGLAGFNLYWGESSRSYGDNVRVPGTAESHTIRLPLGSYYFAVTAIDLEGDESSPSNEVVKQSQ
jgi:outer membrane biosynthesis protein TonB